jgi:hypothetical protein
MEIIGLVVIVILVTLGMLFMAFFAFKEDPQKKIFTRELLAYSTMSALMKTTVAETSCVQEYGTETAPQIEKDLLEDCALNYDTKDTTNGYSLYRCNNRHSCVFLKDLTTNLLNETIGVWGKKYQLTSKLYLVGNTAGIPLLDVKNSLQGCPINFERDTSKPFFLNTEIGLVESVLYICN